MLALSCAPAGRPDAAAAAVMLAELVARRGLARRGCMSEMEINYFTHYS